MGDDEKAQQIGRILKQYSEAKVTLAHLDTKLKSVSQAYKQVGQAIEEGVSARLRIEHNRLQLVLRQEFDGAYLLDEVTLLGLLNERSEAENRVAQLSEQLTGLGIPNVK